MGEKIWIDNKRDAIKLFAMGYKPKDLLDMKLMSKKTCYKWYKVYREMKKIFQSENFANQMILATYEFLVREHDKKV